MNVKESLEAFEKLDPCPHCQSLSGMRWLYYADRPEGYFECEPCAEKLWHNAMVKLLYGEDVSVEKVQ